MHIWGWGDKKSLKIMWKEEYIKSWVFWHWMIQKALWTWYSQIPVKFHHFIYWQYPAPILRVQKAKVDEERLYKLNLCKRKLQYEQKNLSWYLTCFLDCIIMLCNWWWKGLASSVGKTRHEKKWQIKWLVLSLRLEGTLRYTLGVTF
jgi:hypothetical protein